MCMLHNLGQLRALAPTASLYCVRWAGTALDQQHSRSAAHTGQYSEVASTSRTGLTAAAAPIPCTVGGSRAKPKGVRLFSDLTLHRLLSGPIGFGSQGSISDLWGGHINRDESKGASGVA